MKRIVAGVALVLSALALLGCRTGDIGANCRLVRGNPDGGDLLPILESEIPPGRDIISIGAIECEDFFCIRNRYAPPSGTSEAFGTCSRHCVPTTASACDGLDPSADLTQGPFTCRALLLDEVTLEALCQNDPALCTQLGDQRSPYFCAQGATVDAGAP